LLRLLALANSSAAAFLFIPALRIDLGRFSPGGRFVRDRRDFAAILLAEIARRRREGTGGRSDVLSMLMEARDEHGEAMQDEELLDEMFTLLMAGHETTATSLAWVLHHVLPRPDVLEKMRAELRRCLGAAFATYEMKVVLAELLARVDLRVAPGYRMRPVLRTVTVAPSAGMPVVLEARRPG